MLERLSIDKFAEGFVFACASMGVEPTALVKTAQALKDPRDNIPGYGGAANKLLAPPVSAAGNTVETGANTTFTGSSAGAGKPAAMARMNASRKARGVAPITQQQAAPIQRQQPSIPVGRAGRVATSLLPPLAPGMGSLNDVSGGFDTASKNMAKAKAENPNMSGGERLGRGIKQYGGEAWKALTPFDEIKQLQESGTKQYEGLRGVFQPEWLKARKRQQRQEATSKALTEEGKATREAKQEGELLRGEFGVAKQRRNTAGATAMNEYNARRMAAMDSGADMKEWDEDEANKRPEQQDIQFGGPTKKRRTPLLWSSPYQRRKGKGGRI